MWPDLRKKLNHVLKTKPKLLILGIGENRMGDDGIGPYITFHLDELTIPSSVKIINGGIVPENRYEEIIDFNPNIIIIVDAIQMNRDPGSVEFLEEKVIKNFLPISSHSIPLPVFVDRIKHTLSDVTIHLLGICPFSLVFSEKYELFREDLYSLDDYDENSNIPFYAFHLSTEMETIANDLIKFLQNILIENFS